MIMSNQQVNKLTTPSSVSSLSSNIYFNVSSHLKLVLCAKSQLTFSQHIQMNDETNQQTKNDFNLKIKLLFRDSSGYVECVGYNSVALALNKLEIRKQYVLADFKLNYLPLERKEWPEQQLNASYEIMIHNMNSIIPSYQYAQHSNNQSPSEPTSSKLASAFAEPLPPEPVITTSMFKLVDTRRHKEQIQREHGSKLSKAKCASLLDDALLTSGDIVPPTFTSMHEIHHTCALGSVVNTFGVIESIDNMKHINKPNQPEYQLLNIYINDTSDHLTRVAIWNKQATNFAHSIGTVLMMFDLEVVTYKNEFTLNVTKSSHYINVEASYEIDRVEHIRNWYINKCRTKH